MRRKDREMSAGYGLDVIDRSACGVLSLADPAQPELPYSLPLSLARKDDKLYFHSARGGYKYDLLKNGQKVRVVFVDRANVPELFTDEELELLYASGRYGDFLSKVFTTEFSSAIVTGQLEIIDPLENASEFRQAMLAISEKYVPDKISYFDAALDFSRDLLAVYAIRIEEITAKRKQFDADKAEMKWQKMSDS